MERHSFVAGKLHQEANKPQFVKRDGDENNQVESRNLTVEKHGMATYLCRQLFRFA